MSIDAFLCKLLFKKLSKQKIQKKKKQKEIKEIMKQKNYFTKDLILKSNFFGLKLKQFFVCAYRIYIRHL